MRISRYLVLFIITSLYGLILGFDVFISDEERTSEYWKRDAQGYLNESLSLKKNENVAKNIILFLGDGMGMTTVTATRIYKGQKKNRGGEDEHLSFDDFPYVSLAKTYGLDRQTSDSANTGTAYLCGVKANYGTIGVDGRVSYENCESSLDNSTHLTSILQWAQDMGKWSGVVTTTRITHATPAGSYAHAASRDWEASSPSPRCSDIAQQLVHGMPGKELRVILGGGRSCFLPKSHVDSDGKPGIRNDSRNLFEEWLTLKNSNNLKSRIIFDITELRTLQTDDVDYLLGLFDSDHLPYVADKPYLKKEYPSLPEMTESAIKLLSRSDKGYALLVEGGKIDLAHHKNYGKKALEEGVEFDQAIETALRLTDEDDTLIVVTADHSHVFNVGGDYPLRGSDILGIGGVSDIDHRTFTTLGYHNGPGYKKNARQRNLTQTEAIDKDFHQDALVPMIDDSHGAEDVAVYAKGPMSHLFHGVHDQTYIPYVMAYASCIGPNQDHCNGALSLFRCRNQWLMDLVAILVSYVVTHQVHF